MKVYINSAETISPQETFETNEFLNNITIPANNYFTCITLDYKKYIDLKHLRRMSKIVRSSVACSVKSLETAGIAKPDAIIIGTGLGCLDDTSKFLDQIIENNESLLNPSPFIQSVHNSVSGQIALLLNANGYNFTFTQQLMSFETAMLDAILMIKSGNTKNVLLGAVDEITSKTYQLLEKAGCTRPYTNNIYTTQHKGYIPGEGASFFLISNNKLNEDSICIKDLRLFDDIDISKLSSEKLNIISDNHLTIDDIDVLITGNNGSTKDFESYSAFTSLFKNSIHVGYKHLIGQYDTASGFALWLGTKILQNNLVPETVNINKNKKQDIQNILIHSYNKTDKHSFILLSKC